MVILIGLKTLNPTIQCTKAARTPSQLTYFPHIFNKSCPLLPNSSHFYPFPPHSPLFLHFYPFLSTYLKFPSIFIHCMKFFPLDILPPQCVLGHLRLDIQKIKVFQGGRLPYKLGFLKFFPLDILPPTLFGVAIAHFLRIIYDFQIFLHFLMWEQYQTSPMKRNPKGTF